MILTKRGEDVSEFSRVNSSVAVLVKNLETLNEIFVGARIRVQNHFTFTLK